MIIIDTHVAIMKTFMQFAHLRFLIATLKYTFSGIHNASDGDLCSHIVL
jgi:hypothetical protein